MTSEHRILDQLVERITANPGAGLDGLDRKELDAIARSNNAASGEAFAEELELAAAAAMVAGLPARDIRPMPDALRQRILDNTTGARQTTASVTDLASRRPAAQEPAPARGRWFAGLGWAAAAAMFVALAREAGIEAQFYEVNVVPEWTLAGDVVMTTRHVNVGGRIGGNMTYVMDFSPYVVRREIGRRRMTDAEAMAQYYNNIGAGFLADGDLVAAYRQFTAGLSLAPRVSFLWSNLSVVYSRNGQKDAAESVLEAAIALDARNTSAMSNLARLLRLRGDDARAAELSQRIAGVQRDNPYYQFALGERHLAQSRYADALEQLQRAIALEPAEPLFYRKAARAASALNRAELAADYEVLAARLDTAAQRKRREALGL